MHQDKHLGGRPAWKFAALRAVSLENIDTPMATVIDIDDPKKANEWYDDFIDNKGGGEYYLNDLRTQPGIDSVLEFNGWVEDWNSDGHHTKPVRDQYFLLMRKLAAGKMKSDIYLGPSEGMHRCWAITNMMAKSAPDAFYATVQPDTLTPQTFSGVNICGSTIPTKEQFDSDHTMATTFETPEGKMLDGPMHAAVYYATNNEVNVDQLLHAFRTKSQSISAGKLDSARPSPTSLIGKWGHGFINNISATALLNELVTSNHTATVQKRELLVAAQNAWAQSGEKAWGLSELLVDQVLNEYVKNPFDTGNYERMLALLQVRAKSSVATTVKPPFNVSYKTMVAEMGEGKNITGEIRNQYLACPVFMTYLWAGLRGIPYNRAAGDPELVGLIHYTMRFHLGPDSGQANMSSMHGAFTAQYGHGYSTNSTYNQLKGDHQVIAATVFLVHLMNSCIAEANSRDIIPSGSMSATRERFKQAANLFNGALQTMDTRGNSVLSTVQHLSKCFMSVYPYVGNF